MGVVRFRWEWEAVEDGKASGRGPCFADVLHSAGKIPLPPYLKRDAVVLGRDHSIVEEDHFEDVDPATPAAGQQVQQVQPDDSVDYQSVFGVHEGSVAAPTASLHFTNDVLARLPCPSTEVTLHVGAGTFSPMDERLPSVSGHRMHSERISVTVESIKALRSAVRSGEAIVPVGTTAARTLESLYWLGVRMMADPVESSDWGPSGEVPLHLGQWDTFRLQALVRARSRLQAMDAKHGGDGAADANNSGVGPESGDAAQEEYEADRRRIALLDADAALTAILKWCSRRRLRELTANTELMITPGYRFALVDALVTNFHQPKSTLMMLVSAVVGDEKKLIGQVYAHALDPDRPYRFLSFGDALLMEVHADCKLEAARPGGEFRRAVAH
jgi:S-adenosylmethionine:tRNA ribosyltransferase-isomerase